MKIINIKENSTIKLNNYHINKFNKFISNSPSLPIQINDNTLSFDDYTIGSITVGDLTILIQPRINYLTLNNYFEMQLYNDGILSDSLYSLLDHTKEFGLKENLIHLFLMELNRLIADGLVGSYVKAQETTSNIHGKILVDKISNTDLLENHLPIEYEKYTLNTTQNKIIKLALDKILPFITEKSDRNLHSIIYPYFEDIEVFSSDTDLVLINYENEFSYENKNYHSVLKLALKIIKDYNLNMQNNDVIGSSYLVNSNNLFETYARKVLSNHLYTSVEKWSCPKKMGQFKIKNYTYTKSYIPDIVIDYHSDNNYTLAILDAKNKDISNFQNIGKLNDLYQIIFYGSNLKSKYSGLIYPYYNQIDPVRINVDSLIDNNIYAFFIDFSKPIGIRNKKFVKQVSTTFHVK